MTTTLHQISPLAFSHPLDRTATEALSRVPALPSMLRRLARSIGDQNIELLFQSSALRIGPDQYPHVHETLIEVCTTLDTAIPPLFVSAGPTANAGAVGFADPFVVISSELVEVASERELAVVLGHEVGHILAGHALYRTMAQLLSGMLGSFMPIGAAALLPLSLALLEWSRKAELSADRAGLLAVQDMDASLRILARLSGGLSARHGEVNTEAFLAQNQGRLDASTVSRLFQLASTLPHSHPMPVPRAVELQNWKDSGAYDRILDGEYPRRPNNLPVPADLVIADDYYEDSSASGSAGDASSAPTGFSETASRIFTDSEQYVTNTIRGLIDRLGTGQDRSKDNAANSKRRPPPGDDDPLADYLDDWPMPE